MRLAVSRRRGLYTPELLDAVKLALFAPPPPSSSSNSPPRPRPRRLPRPPPPAEKPRRHLSSIYLAAASAHPADVAAEELPALARVSNHLKQALHHSLMGSSLSTPAPAPEAGGVWGSSRGSELRAQAHAATAACQAAARDSQAAWRANRKAEAAILSAESKRAAALRDALHLQAEEEIFQFFNPDYPSAATAGGGGLWGWMLGAWGGMGADGEVKDGLRRCDLHGLLVKEAVGRVEAHLRTCRERGVERTLIITGRGLHSDGGVAKVKPEVETWLRGQRVSVQWVDGGGAADVVLLEAQQEPEGWAAWGWKQIFG